MVNTIALQTIEDGPKNLIVKLNISGDASGEETATMFVDISAYATASGRTPTGCKILTVTANLFTFDAVLLWDATTDILALALPGGGSVTDFRYMGGLRNDSGSGKTGDIRFTTVGLGAADYGTIVLEMSKEYD